MRAFFLRRRRLHLWLLADLAVVAAYYASRHNAGWMARASEMAGAVRRAIGALCYRTDVSVAETGCVLLVLAGAGYFVWSAAAIVRARGRRGRRAYTAALGAACAGATAWALFCALWGVTCYAPGFQAQSGIYAQDVAVEDLYAVTDYFARKLSETAGAVPRDDGGLFAADREEILDASVHAYDALETEFPFLAFDDPGVKAVRLSRVMSMLDFTGVYCPYTGESNVNVDAPACLLAATAAHELAHQRGFASEQECNFLAVLASTTCGDSVYAYSGYLLGYIHLGNALYSADQTLWRQVYDSLPDTVRADLNDNNAYWRQFQDTTVQKVSNAVYDGFLKSVGQENGMRSYGMVVDLLVAYYAPLI